MSTSAPGLAWTSLCSWLGAALGSFGTQGSGVCPGQGAAWEETMPGKPVFLPRVFAPPVAPERPKETVTGHTGRRGAEGHPVPFTPSPSSFPLPRPAEDRAQSVCAGWRLTRSARVTWAGHVQPAPFLPQQLAHKQPGCCWRWRQRHVRARGWGTWPCPSRGKALAQHRPALRAGPPPSPQEIPSAPSLLQQNMFLGSDFQYGWSQWALQKERDRAISRRATSRAGPSLGPCVVGVQG
uniref:Uncharacterized protein n=1 Tax=Pipistrellus kuhlii TaxID=59472 RepID=A0A7J7SUZ0_PIPKU|nr:hypothetical protein mPipKuh1_009773 [Pipistrellus kuhlii]